MKEMDKIKDQLKKAEEEQKYWENKASRSNSERDDLRRKLEEANKTISFLKGELSSALLNNARLQGYIDRTHEDDLLRDGKSEITEQRLEPCSTQIRKSVPQYYEPPAQDMERYSAEKRLERIKPWWDR